MDKPITINKLFNYCKEQIKEGNGNKVIMISDDDEGNGYHYLWYSFSDPTDEDFYIEGFEECFIDKKIAKIEDTIILG